MTGYTHWRYIYFFNIRIYKLKNDLLMTIGAKVAIEKLMEQV